jgi:hypothetical protein
VSDFLSRVAARAVGEAPVARPRLPALFDEPGARADPGLDIADEEIGAEVGLAPVSAPSSGAADPAPARPPATVAPGVGAPTTVSPEAATPARRKSHAAPALPMLSGERDERESDAAVAPPEPETPAQSAAAVPALAARMVHATPAVPSFTPLTAAAAPTTRTRDETPPVRVHIGRLEVRANLQETHRPPRRQQDSAPEGLSLSDYLRGKRVVG